MKKQISLIIVGVLAIAMGTSVYADVAENQEAKIGQSSDSSYDDLARTFNVPRSNTVGVGLLHDNLTKGRGAWNGAYLDLEHRFAPRTLLYSRLLETRRFGLQDEQILVGGYYPIQKDITLNVEGTYSPSAYVLARNSILGSLQFGLGSGWLITGGIKHTDYENSNSIQEFGVLENYFGNYRAALTITDTQAQGENMVGGNLSLSRYYNDTSFVSLVAGTGREADKSSGSTKFLNTNSLGLNGRHWFTPDWGMVWSLTEGQEGNAYNYTGVSIGLRHNF
jgi:YaiO family outer membrane protein